MMAYQRNMKIFAELSVKTELENSPAILEIELIKLCNPQTGEDISSILKRLTHVENVLELAMHGRIEDAVKEYDALNCTTLKQKTSGIPVTAPSVKNRQMINLHLIS